MQRTRSVFKVLVPSPGSTLAIILLSIGILFAGSWAFIKSTNALFNTISGGGESSGVSGVIGQQIEGVDTLLGSDQLGSLTVFLFWALTGFIVFLLITYAITTLQEFEEEVKLTHNTSADEQHRFNPLKVSLEHGVFRVGVIVLVVMYTTLLARYVVPVFLATFKVGILELSTWSGWSYLLTSVLGVAICLHVYTVLARLFILRYRVLG